MTDVMTLKSRLRVTYPANLCTTMHIGTIFWLNFLILDLAIWVYLGRFHTASSEKAVGYSVRDVALWSFKALELVAIENPYATFY